MIHHSASTSRTPRSTTRVSLACAPCRSKHLRCDATTPRCSRCQIEDMQCVYPKSRRGGRRRPVSSSQLAPENVATLEPSPPPSLDEIVLASSNPTSTTETTEGERSNSEPATSVSTHSDSPGDSFMAEGLISQYYSFFHAAHPCVLPQWALKQRLSKEDAGQLQTLSLVIQYVGSIFVKSVVLPSSRAKAEQAISSIGVHSAATGFDVQALLLFSIAVYWGDEIPEALSLLDEAIALALKLGMNTQKFAYTNGNNDALLEECWRRTWWQLYVTDAHIAGSTHTFPFRTSKVAMDVDLPCSEEDYEAGNIPRPRTLQEYDMREFLDDDDRSFSSFAELAGLTRSLDLALTGRQSLDIASAPAICANTDASVTAWRSLLPPLKRDIVRGDGAFDEILFKANMIIHTYIVDIHRQLSTLAYSPVEAISRCSPPPPPEGLRGCNSLECQLHTAKVLRSIDQFDELLTLPTNIATHTPFIICMISNTAIAHLAACRYFYQGQQLKLARERIRLNMGVLKVLGEYWPMGQRIYREVGIIAREILGLSGSQVQPSVGPSTEQTSSSGTRGEVELSPVSAFVDQQGLVPDIQLLDANFDFCGLFDLNVACT